MAFPHEDATGRTGSTEQVPPGFTADHANDNRSVARRVDPTGKQALFSASPVAARDQLGSGNQKDGRHAFFSTGPRQPGTAVVKCSSCHTRTRVSLLDLGIRLVSLSAWMPGRRHRHFMRCPACHTHQWCDIGWTV